MAFDGLLISDRQCKLKHELGISNWASLYMDYLRFDWYIYSLLVSLKSVLLLDNRRDNGSNNEYRVMMGLELITFWYIMSN